MKKLLLLCLFFPLLSPAGDFITGLNLSSPLLLSGSVGYRFSSENSPGMSPMVEAEAGIGGTKILLGVDGMDEGFGFGVKASLLNTWFEPINVDADQQYLGVELQMGNTGFIASLGGYARIEGDDDSWITTFSFGIRFK